MKKQIAILGSTGSIGKTVTNILDADKNKFEVVLLSANKNYRKLHKQAIKYKVKNLIITNYSSYKILKKINKNKKINIYNDFKSLNKIFNKRIDYIISAITGIDGVLIKFTLLLLGDLS